MVYASMFASKLSFIQLNIHYSCHFRGIIQVHLSQYHVPGSPGTAKNPLLAQC
jgi:hypothetical protein